MSAAALRCFPIQIRRGARGGDACGAASRIRAGHGASGQGRTRTASSPIRPTVGRSLRTSASIAFSSTASTPMRLTGSQRNRRRASPARRGAASHGVSSQPAAGFRGQRAGLHGDDSSIRRRAWRTVLLQSRSTLPEGWSGTSYVADIHVAPSGRTLYVSNRGHNSVAVFSIAGPTGVLTLEQVVSTEGDWPRNFTLDPSGRWLLVANQRSGSIVVFRRDPDSGRVTPTPHRLALPSPVCLRFRGHHRITE